MSDVSTIKPWSKDDIANAVRSLYFTTKTTLKRSSAPKDEKSMRWLGSLDGFSSVLLAVGINPADVFDKEDLEFMARMNRNSAG